MLGRVSRVAETATVFRPGCGCAVVVIRARRFSPDCWLAEYDMADFFHQGTTSEFLESGRTASAVVVEQVSYRRILVAFNVGVPLVIERKKKYRCLGIVIV